MVVITADGELLTSAPSSVAGEMSLVRMGFKESINYLPSEFNRLFSITS